VDKAVKEEMINTMKRNFAKSKEERF